MRENKHHIMSSQFQYVFVYTYIFVYEEQCDNIFSVRTDYLPYALSCVTNIPLKPKLSEAGNGMIDRHRSHNMTFLKIGEAIAQIRTIVYNYLKQKKTSLKNGGPVSLSRRPHRPTVYQTVQCK